MEQGYRRVFAQVDLDAVVFNMQSMRDRLPAHMKMAAVVKTDAYGHGAVPVALAADPFVSFFMHSLPGGGSEPQDERPDKTGAGPGAFSGGLL